MVGYCKKNEELSVYLDGEMDVKSRLKFETHLGQCSACQTMLQDMRSLRECFQSLPQQEVGFDLAPLVLSDLGRTRTVTIRPRFNWWQLFPVSFTVAATVLLGLFLGSSLSSRPDAELVAVSLAMFDPVPPAGICIELAGCYPKEKI